MTTFAEAVARLRAGVEAAAADAGLEVSGELRGVVCDAGRPETGTGFAVAGGAGLPPGWVPHAEVGALRARVAELEAELERLRAVVAEKGGS
jgi:hypothetical protein